MWRIRVMEPDDHPAVRAMIGDPGLERQFENLLAAGALDDVRLDPWFVPGLALLALDDDEPVGFAIGLLIRHGEESFAFLRIGVPERMRRRGIGTALLQQSLERLPTVAGLREIAIAAWL